MKTFAFLKIAIEDPDFPVKKISDKKLFDLVLNESNEKATVIIQLNLTKSKLKINKEVSGLYRQIIQGIQPETDKEKKEIKLKTLKAKEFLKKVLGAPPRWLSIPRVFIAKVNGKELQKIAASPIVKNIYPNRNL